MLVISELYTPDHVMEDTLSKSMRAVVMQKMLVSTVDLTPRAVKADHDLNNACSDYDGCHASN